MVDPECSQPWIDIWSIPNRLLVDPVPNDNQDTGDEDVAIYEPVESETRWTARYEPREQEIEPEIEAETVNGRYITVVVRTSFVGGNVLSQISLTQLVDAASFSK